MNPTESVNKNQQYEQMNPATSGFKHISFSEFSLFNECAHKHLVLKHLKLDVDKPSIHLFFGNSVHEAIELSVKDGMDIDGRVAHFRKSFQDKMLENMISDPSFSELNDFLSQGENILRTLDLNKIFDEYEIVSVEEALYEKIHGIYYFKGFIDLIAHHKVTGRYLIIDWKTSGEAWDVKKKLMDAIFMCQMRFYKFFWGRKHGVSMSDIDCKYIVLNRLKFKKNHYGGFGETQIVPIQSTEEEIKNFLETPGSDCKENTHIVSIRES